MGSHLKASLSVKRIHRIATKMLNDIENRGKIYDRESDLSKSIVRYSRAHNDAKPVIHIITAV